MLFKARLDNERYSRRRVTGLSAALQYGLRAARTLGSSISSVHDKCVFRRNNNQLPCVSSVLNFAQLDFGFALC